MSSWSSCWGACDRAEGSVQLAQSTSTPAPTPAPGKAWTAGSERCTVGISGTLRRVWPGEATERYRSLLKSLLAVLCSKYGNYVSSICHHFKRWLQLSP